MSRGHFFCEGCGRPARECDGKRCDRELDAYYSRFDRPLPLPPVDWDGDDRDDFERMFPPGTSRRDEAERY